MDFKDAQRVLEQLEASQLKGLYEKLLRDALRYAAIRVEWFMASQEERIAMDADRTIAHNTFISSCDIMARNMAAHGEDSTWRNELGPDRKVIGDFACYLYAIMGVRAR